MNDLSLKPELQFQPELKACLNKLARQFILSILSPQKTKILSLSSHPFLSSIITMLTPFHLAIQVRNIAEAREFYGTKLGLSEGRSADAWIDWNMFGHQVVTHLNPNLGPTGRVPTYCNPVDSHAVPVPHFGVVLTIKDWEALSERIRTLIDHFIIEPYVRFKGQTGEQCTMFFEDPSGNALEFKAFADIESQLFAK